MTYPYLETWLSFLNNTHLVIIPKTKHPTLPNHFSPIGYCNVLYKILSNILVKWVNRLMSTLISSYQGKFFPHRQITDSLLLANEAFRAIKHAKSRHGFVALKLDLDKAYDKVSQDILFSILQSLGLLGYWFNLVKECATITRISFLINGHPIPYFQPPRGLKQGDTLSPYIFLFIMEYFTMLFHHNLFVDKPLGIKIGKHCPPLPLILFANDCIIFSKVNLTHLFFHQIHLTSFLITKDNR